MLAANEDSLARTTGIRPAKDFSGERPERKRNSAVWSFENLRGRLAELSGGPRSRKLAGGARRRSRSWSLVARDSIT